MGLSFFYEFTAPATTPASELETFLWDVERETKALGFDPTTVMNVPFDTPERRKFSRRLHGSMYVEDARLKGVALPRTDQVRDPDPTEGSARLIPARGVVLVITDERGCETVFGFLQFPEQVTDIHGAILADTGLQGRWWFRDFVDSPDSRYRAIVANFSERGFVCTVKDEFASLQ